ncbi:MAG: bL35 family ribosomal protein [bacterium]
MKTNKSYSKRLKVTKNGKILARTAGQNHFNAKAPRSVQLAAKKENKLTMTNKSRSRFLVNI